MTNPSNDGAGHAARRLAIYTVDAVVARGRTLDEGFNEGVSKLGLAQLAGRDRGFARLIACRPMPSVSTSASCSNVSFFEVCNLRAGMVLG